MCCRSPRWDALTYLSFNLWLASLAELDLPKAKEYASRISVPGSTVKLDPWKKVKSWRFFKLWLQKNPKLEPEVARMYEEQRIKLSAEQASSPQMSGFSK